MKYTLVKSDGTTSVKTRMTLKQMQDFVGGYIEMHGNVICNEDGRLQNLPPNAKYPIYVGNIILKEAGTDNACSKSRKVDDPYEIWIGYGKTEGWEWRVLKKYQTPEKEAENPYARWFCAVKSPFTYGSWEYGDTYIKDVVGYARMVKGEPDLRKVLRDEVDKRNIFRGGEGDADSRIS